MTFRWFVILAVITWQKVAAMNDYPGLVLTNGVIRVSVFLPDAKQGYYRGTRFDWSGIIEQVEFRGHRYYQPLHAEHDPYRHDSVGGPAEEFAMFNPMGFAEAGPGESFIKIGVGLLQKGHEQDYRFDGDYPLIRAGDWDIDYQSDRVEFEQDFRGDRGWAYRYRKIIRLLENRAELVIEHRLENSGDKTIDINHYNHNFTIIDGVDYGPDYRVEFPFATDQPQSINDLAWFRDDYIETGDSLAGNSLWIQLYEGDARSDYNAATVRNLRTGASVAFKGDAGIDRMVFWGVDRAACPEPFIKIYLEPGQSREWSTVYRYRVE